ncbi:unnamed protein product [Clonostachys rosea f. rosea IK726]|uniref:Uncharacterized protein n=1 Tax=Clonostachys rosea f. rosea IK726 TaxID=1349383 RepID=A0ACA9TNU0_BIOOC|nr:unnamed protein product [Clonostachys rosea f. rosea IK726]
MAYPKYLLKQDVWSKDKELGLEIYPSLDNTAIHYERARRGYLVLDPEVLEFAYGSYVLSYHKVPGHITNIGKAFVARDSTCLSILVIHYNLCLGTIIPFARKSPEIAELVQKMLNFDVNGQFMLTELDHGLDARNLETTATLLPDGSFELHTPHPGAAKSMPPNTTASGIPRTAVLYARLIVDQEDRGVRPFVVPLSEAGRLKPGITSKILPVRPGTKPLDHCITTFDRVLLPSYYLLGSTEKPNDARASFMRSIWRVPIGSISLSMAGITGIKIGTHLTAAYSLRRTVGSTKTGDLTPIMSFSTQYRPIVNGHVQATVLEAYARWAIKQFMNPKSHLLVRSALGVIFKTTVIQASRILTEFSERCGWQGLFSYNQISNISLSFQGNAIAEGDTLVLCIRLASELLGEKYRLPEALDPSSLLAKGEIRAMTEAKAKLSEIGGYKVHRGADYNRHILPRSRPLIESIGHRMAYEAAKEEGLSPNILKLYESLCAVISPYSISDTIDQDRLTDIYEEVLAGIMPQFEKSEMKDYFTAPIASKELWDNFFQSLPSEECLRNPKAKL